MGTFTIYFIGWIIFSIMYFIYNAYIEKDNCYNKKVLAWRSILIGFISWIGIIFVISISLVCIFIYIEDWIETKLNSF